MCSDQEEAHYSDFDASYNPNIIDNENMLSSPSKILSNSGNTSFHHIENSSSFSGKISGVKSESLLPETVEVDKQIIEIKKEDASEELLAKRAKNAAAARKSRKKKLDKKV